MSNARNLARLLPDSSGKIALPSQVSGVLPDVNAPSGSVLQVVGATNATAVTFSADGMFDVISASITIAANSKICIMGSIPHYAPEASTWGSAVSTSLHENGTQILNNEHDGVAINTGATQQIPILFTTTAKTAGTYTYVVKASKVISGTHYLNRDGRSSNLVLMEIAP